MITSNLLIAMLSAIAAIFGVGFIQGRNNVKNKIIKEENNVAKEAKKTRKEAENISASKLESELDKLLND